VTTTVPASRGISLVVCALAYLGAFFAGAYVVQTLFGMAPMVALGSANLAAVIVIFTFSVAYDNSSLFDPYWSVAPPLAALFCVTQAGAQVPGARQALVVALLLVWGMRRTANWARSWEGLRHEDWRYVALRARTGRAYWLASFLGIHLAPAAVLLLATAPVAVALATGTQALGPLDAVATLVSAGAIAIEAIADAQLRRHRREAPPGTTCVRGLWAHSRHPNYFGEMSFWWGLYLFAVAARPEIGWLVAGPLAITLTFVFVSIPLLDRRALERRPDYARHMQRVSAVVPWIRAD
jgi:steroid 5-alpha reductase family enzyme